MDDVQVRDYRRRNRVCFSPAPENTSFPTTPKIVETRRIADLTLEHLPKHEGRELPTGVEYIFFDQVVELNFVGRVDTREQGSCESLTTIGLNSEIYHVAWSKEQAEKLRGNHWKDIEVHPSLVGKMWVFGDSVAVAAQKRRSTGPTVVIDGKLHREPKRKQSGGAAGMG